MTKKKKEITIKPAPGSIFLRPDEPAILPVGERGHAAKNEIHVGLVGTAFDVLADEVVGVAILRVGQRSTLALALHCGPE